MTHDELMEEVRATIARGEPDDLTFARRLMSLIDIMLKDQAAKDQAGHAVGG